MKVIGISCHSLERAPWVDRAHTVDRIIPGDPERELSRSMVTWISSLSACRAAVEYRAELLITHEPTFYKHWDREVDEELASVRLKRSPREESGLVILRNHDVWDRFPEIGIPWAWASLLRLGTWPTAVNSHGLHGCDVAPLPFGDLVRHVAARTARIGEPVLQFLGDPAERVSRNGCDCSVVCDDGTNYWREEQLAEDTGRAGSRWTWPAATRRRSRRGSRRISFRTDSPNGREENRVCRTNRVLWRH